MKKSLDDLLDENLVEKFTSTQDQIIDLIQLSESDLKCANKIISEPDCIGWAYKIAYNSMLQASRALMFHDGYRAKTSGPFHKSTAQFIVAMHSDKITLTALNAFQKGRIERNRSQYEQADVISQSQAEFIIAQAKIFLADVKSILKV